MSVCLHGLLLSWLVHLWMTRPTETVKEPPTILRISLRNMIRRADPKKPELDPERETPKPPEKPTKPAPTPPKQAPPDPSPENTTARESEDASPAEPAPSAPKPSLAPPTPKWIGLAGPPPIDGRPKSRGYGNSNRYGGEKAAALERHGGSGATENAVEAGLRWLSEHQHAAGHWDSDGFQQHCGHHSPCKGRGQPEFDVGVTSLALLAYLGAGHDPANRGPYRRIVRKGLDYLVSAQDGSGTFGGRLRTNFYNHSLATFALVEAYAVARFSKDEPSLAERYKESAEAAIRFSWRAQQSGGGWDYSADLSGRDDLSITGWQILALKSAQNSGVSIPVGMIDKVKGFTRRHFTARGFGIYANKGLERNRGGINMASVGMLSFLTLGGDPNSAACRSAADRMVRKNPPNLELARKWDRTFQSYYYWYSATLCLFHLGGPRWEAWNHQIQKAILPLQSKGPHESGSWPPEPNWIGASGGRVYATAINVLTLETYYRYKPLWALRD